MRTTISIPDDLAEQVRRRSAGMSLSEFARLALAERLGRLEKQELARSMSEGYAAEAASPSLEAAWDVTEAEGWE